MGNDPRRIDEYLDHEAFGGARQHLVEKEVAQPIGDDGGPIPCRHHLDAIDHMGTMHPHHIRAGTGDDTDRGAQRRIGSREVLDPAVQGNHYDIGR
jgi:hypothetical protein